MGIIETLRMTNFMCHKTLSFTFGPQMNFIIGKSHFICMLLLNY